MTCTCATPVVDEKVAPWYMAAGSWQQLLESQGCVDVGLVFLVVAHRPGPITEAPRIGTQVLERVLATVLAPGQPRVGRRAARELALREGAIRAIGGESASLSVAHLSTQQHHSILQVVLLVVLVADMCVLWSISECSCSSCADIGSTQPPPTLQVFAIGGSCGGGSMSAGRRTTFLPSTACTWAGISAAPGSEAYSTNRMVAASLAAGPKAPSSSCAASMFPLYMASSSGMRPERDFAPSSAPDFSSSLTREGTPKKAAR
eukprot:CAMPEP_0181202312 /NCGR_PEP_ID=MMETSP1096-20121128/18773_1 /TAXON_ID=156174 ORGANISM="Chrysochromulina ericina, Strain CCMP281" /NCGR_SAMPLE_ID=MMETSP1096 /ASSEMBLY_ACC=CAM_ASM_000453 /LENGTH=260 /DNA_ID=CAMNT_0023292813 /DNA_START=896 /DNA_END=1680 /DNA_ORIENTATION=-